MEENLNELIKTDNATVVTFGKDKQPKSTKSKILKPKPVFGTKEWADRNENCLNGSANELGLEVLSKTLGKKRNIFLRKEH